MTYEITYFHIISLIYNVYFVKLSISLQDLGIRITGVGILNCESDEIPSSVAGVDFYAV
jgi:hypothetical protein